MSERICCFLDNNVRCTKPAEWEMWSAGAVHEFVDSCTEHVGPLLDDAPEIRIFPIPERTVMPDNAS